MPRPVKIRRVEAMPGITCFKPAGIPMRLLDKVVLSIEEAEAIRLKDLEKLEQEKCAVRMRVSRPTFQRILASGRQKIAEALFQGKAIRIDGGTYAMEVNKYRCLNGHEWDVLFNDLNGEKTILCPECETGEIVSVQPDGSKKQKGSMKPDQGIIV